MFGQIIAFVADALRDGPLENLWAGEQAKYKTKNSCKGKLNEKNSCTSINPKKYSCYGLKKNHTRNLITKMEEAGKPVLANLQENSGLEGILSKHFFWPEEGFKVPIALSLFAVNDPCQLPSVILDMSLRSTVTDTEELG